MATNTNIKFVARIDKFLENQFVFVDGDWNRSKFM